MMDFCVKHNIYPTVEVIKASEIQVSVFVYVFVWVITDAHRIAYAFFGILFFLKQNREPWRSLRESRTKLYEIFKSQLCIDFL